MLDEERQAANMRIAFVLESVRVGRAVREPLAAQAEAAHLAIVEEMARLRARVTELQTRMSEIIEERRQQNLTLQVQSFHRRFGQPLGGAFPLVMDNARVKQRLALGAEEMCEQLNACFRLNPAIEHALMDEIKYAHIRVDLPAWVDGIGDSNYIAAGTAIELGVDMRPIHALIHEANMAKEPNGLGKPTKPPGWKAPDIAGELKRQGWISPEWPR
jgi:predicted HAD superfamily Cof-like phosphohydrolase